jgi:hypothetical protein
MTISLTRKKYSSTRCLGGFARRKDWLAKTKKWLARTEIRFAERNTGLPGLKIALPRENNAKISKIAQ